MVDKGIQCFFLIEHQRLFQASQISVYFIGTNGVAHFGDGAATDDDGGIAAGGLAGWAVMTFVMESDFVFEPVSAIAIVAGGVFATRSAGLLFALRPLAARPAQVLRAQD